MKNSGKAAVVTGAAGDLGRALCDRFLNGGYTVYAGDIEPADPREGLVPSSLDVTNREAVVGLARRASDECDELVVWVNAAGIFAGGAVKDSDPDTWHRVIAVNLSGTYHGCSAALDVMSAQGRGRIVNIGSLSGQVGGTGVHPAYGASKAGVHALTKTYALEGAKYGVYCNAVAPSVLEGNMMQGFSEKQLQRLLRGHPLRRFGRMEEVVDAVSYLASDRASYTNGVTLPINGGSYMP